MKTTDILIIGAGAAGLMCAMVAAQRGRRVCIIEHNAKPAEKIRISGGGRCNFTNIHTRPTHYLSNNPRFCVSALSRYTPQDFITLITKHHIAYHEKTLGQLFCDGSAQQIINMLVSECQESGAELHLSTKMTAIIKQDEWFHVTTSAGEWRALSVVVASGGLSIPKMGATGCGYEIAKQFGIALIPTTAALVPFTLSEKELTRIAPFSGVGLDSVVTCGSRTFEEAMLFTHRGLSGPAMLQISSYWDAPSPLIVNLAPHEHVEALLIAAKTSNPKQEALTVLAKFLPKRLAAQLTEYHGITGRLADISHARLRTLAQAINAWHIIPSGTEGYRTAEVTKGGVDTDALSSQTMESRSVKGLYFIGEVVDVTGHLGGFNFQWAWASGDAAGLVA